MSHFIMVIIIAPGHLQHHHRMRVYASYGGVVYGGVVNANKICPKTGNVCCQSWEWGKYFVRT